MSLFSRITFPGTPFSRLVAVNVITVLVMAVSVVLVSRTFNQINILFDRDVKQNLKVALNSFELSRELLQATIFINQTEDTNTHDPEAMVAARVEVERLLDDIFSKIQLSDNIFSSGETYQNLLKYRQVVSQHLLNNIELSKLVLQLDLADKRMKKALDDMETIVGRVIVENVLAGREVTGLYQINSLIPFCRVQLFEAASVLDTAVGALLPEELVREREDTDQKKTVMGMISGVAKTLDTLLSAHPDVVKKVEVIIDAIESYRSTLVSLQELLIQEKLHKERLGHINERLNLQLSAANKNMANSLIMIGVNTETAMGSATKKLVVLFALIIIVAGGGVIFAYFIGSQMARSMLDLQAAQDKIQEKMTELIQEVGRRKKAEKKARALSSQLEQTVEKRTVELRETNKELEGLVYSMSHDLRTPLRGISGFSHALRDDYSESLDNNAQEYLKRIEEGSVSMGKTIDAIIELSRLSREEIYRMEFDMSAMAQSIVDELRRNEPDRSVQVNITEGLIVSASQNLMRSVLENLFENAWKFTAPQANARIVFGAEEQKRGTVYYIRDNGVGFDMVYGHKMFGTFQRLHPREDFAGIGVGLAVVQRVIRKHGGTVWAEGRVGKGATFYFTLNPSVLKDKTSQ